MLYLVISNPQPSKPSDAKDTRLTFRTWIAELKSNNKVVCFYPQVGRGSVVIFDISSNDELHTLLTQWSEIIPAGFGIYPLASPAEAESLIKGES